MADGLSACLEWRGAPVPARHLPLCTETGKKRLSEVLQAMAEDHIFRSVLTKAQERVDEAFNKTGSKKAGKNSRWTRHREAIRQADERHRQSQDELKNTEALESQLQELLDQKLRCQESVNAAENLLQKVEEDVQKTTAPTTDNGAAG